MEVSPFVKKKIFLKLKYHEGKPWYMPFFQIENEAKVADNPGEKSSQVADNPGEKSSQVTDNPGEKSSKVIDNPGKNSNPRMEVTNTSSSEYAN